MKDAWLELHSEDRHGSVKVWVNMSRATYMAESETEGTSIQFEGGEKLTVQEDRP